jgi:O-antigen ligase
MAFNLFLLLIFIRPFISSLGYPHPDMYYSCFLILVSLALVKSKRALWKGFSGEGWLLLFFLAVIISAFSSFEPIKGCQNLPKYISYLAVFYAVYYAGKKEKKQILLTLILTASCVSLYAIYWLFIGSSNLLGYMREQNLAYPFARELLARKRAFMPYVLPSMLASYLIMMLPVSFAWLLTENKGNFARFNLRNTIFTCPILLIFPVLLLTKSVGASLSMLISLLIFILLSRRFNKRILLLILTLFSAFTAIIILRNYRTESFTTPLFSLQQRLVYWQNTLSVIREHPWRGTGLGNLPFIQSQFTHNSYLQIWAETGLLGIIGFLGFLYQGIKTIRAKRLITDKLFAGLIIANLCFLIHSLVDFSFFLPEVSLFWWIIAAQTLSYLASP